VATVGWAWCCDGEDEERIQKFGGKSFAKCTVPRQRKSDKVDVRNMDYKDGDFGEIFLGPCPLAGLDNGVAER
jgi:hypothetical protein